MDRRELLESMASRLEAAMRELQSVAHDARMTGMPTDELVHILEELLRLRDGLLQLGESLPP